MPEQEIGDYRYGTSALDISMRAIAENDELLVQAKDGRMYYKRPDGQIVTAYLNYDKNSIIKDMMNAVAFTKTPANGSAICYAIDISMLANLVNGYTETLNLGEDSVIKIPKGGKGFFFRVRGNDTTNTAIEYLTMAHTDPENKEPQVKIKIGITPVADATEALSPEIAVSTASVLANKITNIPADVETEYEVVADFNDLVFVSIDSTTDIEVRFKEISYPKLFSAWKYIGEEKRQSLINLNMDNKQFEATVLDVVIFSTVTNANENPVYSLESKVAFNMQFPISDYVDEVNAGAGGVVMSDTKPEYPCLWVMPRDPGTIFDE